MKTSEFIKEVEELGFDTEVFLKTGINVRTEYGKGVLTIGSQSVYKINCFYDAYDNLSSRTREKLFNLAVEYASTPLSERKEEKKYWIKIKKITEGESYLNKHVELNELFFSDKKERYGYKTQFTKKEIEEHGLHKFADNELFELIEVK